VSFPATITPIRLSRRGGRLWPVMFKSPTLNARANVLVYTPPGVGPNDDALAHLPVLYLLHGMWGSELDWAFKGNAQAILDREILAGRVRPMIVAIPNDGLHDDGTFYSNWHHNGPRFEDYVLGDVRRFVEVETLGRLRPRRRRLVAGNSLGGFGALTLALRHPTLFAAAASLSGAVRPIGSPRRRTLGVEIFGPLSPVRASYRRQRDPHMLIEDRGRTGRLGLYLDCGRGDFLLPMNRKFHAKLLRLNVVHTYGEYAGDHSWPCWQKRLPHALRFLSGQLAD